MILGNVLIKLENLAYIFLDSFYKPPYLCPFLFFLMRFPENGNIEKFRKEALPLLEEEDVTEFIEGVGADEAINMVSRLFNSIDMSEIEGLEEFVLSLEEHPRYR